MLLICLNAECHIKDSYLSDEETHDIVDNLLQILKVMCKCAKTSVHYSRNMLYKNYFSVWLYVTGIIRVTLFFKRRCVNSNAYICYLRESGALLFFNNSNCQFIKQQFSWLAIIFVDRRLTC